MSQQTDDLLRQVIEARRGNTEMRDELCLGLALSSFFGLNRMSLLRVLHDALEDGNHHSDSAVIRAMMEPEDPLYQECLRTIIDHEYQIMQKRIRDRAQKGEGANDA